MSNNKREELRVIKLIPVAPFLKDEPIIYGYFHSFCPSNPALLVYYEDRNGKINKKNMDDYETFFIDEYPEDV